MSTPWQEILVKLDDYHWEIPTAYKAGMSVPGLIFANEAMLNHIWEEHVFQQVANVAFLPGIVNYSLAMPDIHWGYGFPIGGVAATRVKDGVVSPGGVGFDINCGVRLLRTNLTVEEVKPKIERLVTELFVNIPSGLGSTGKIRVNEKELNQVLIKGSRWAVEKGYGEAADIIVTEESGCIKGANPDKVSSKAKKRGIPQLGTLGSGNHFLEVEVVDKIDDWYMVKPPQSAVAWVNVDFVARYSTLEKYEKEEESKVLAAQKFDELEQAYVKELGKAPAESGFEPLLREYQDFFLAHPDFIDAELVDKRIKEIELKVAAATYLKSQEALEKKLSELEKTKITALTVPLPIIGEVVDLTTPKSRLPYPVTHNLLVDEEIGGIFIKEIGYYLKSDKYVLNRYLYRKVKVWGKVLISAAWEYPVIMVEKLERVN